MKLKTGLVLWMAVVSFIFIGSINYSEASNPPRVAIHSQVAEPVNAGKIKFVFQLFDLKENRNLTDKDLAQDQEKQLHFFTFDPALVEYRHIHPEYDGSVWSVDTTLETNGNYWVWAEGEISADKTEFYSSMRVRIQNGKPENPLPPTLGDVRRGVDGTSAISLSNEVIRSKKMTMLMLTFSRTDGGTPDIGDYLGSKAHVATVPKSGDELIHIHPMATSKPTQLMLHTEFPQAGDYRMWIQFLDGGVLKTIPLSVNVK